MTTEEQIEAARQLLEQLALATGITREELDRRLGWFRGATSRLLTGHGKLTYEHILLLLKALDVEPDFFFQTLHGRGPLRAGAGVHREDFRAALEEVGGTWTSEPWPAMDEELDREDLARRMEAAVYQVLQRRGIPVPPADERP